MDGSLRLESPEIILELKSFINYCKNFNKIYLYGAGKIGRKYLELLSIIGKRPVGFIVTEGQFEIIDGVEVTLVSKIRQKLTDDVAVIAAFKGAEKSYIRSMIGNLPSLYIPSDDFYSILEMELTTIPFFKSISRQKKVVKQKEHWDSILVIRLDVLGDAIMSTAFIRELRKNCPQSHITLVANSGNELLFKDCPYITELCLYNTGNQPAENSNTLDYLQQLYKKVKKFVDNNLSRHFDIAFQLCSLLSGRNSLEAIMIGLASEIDCQVGRVYSFKKSKHRAAYLYERFSQLLSCVTYDEMPKHEVACMLDMLRKCGGVVRDDKLELWFRDEAKVTLPINIDRQKKWLAIGIVGRLPYQCWPLERFRELIARLDKKHTDLGFIILGGQDAEAGAARVVSGLQNEIHVINLAGMTTLVQLAAIMKMCVAYVGANTGLMHMAAALELPVVEISSYVRGEDGQVNSPMGAWGVKTIILQDFGMDGCREICSKSYAHCIRQISVDQVVEAVENLLLEGRNIVV